jgi:uncharacterized RDD family membrane protein YckC
VSRAIDINLKDLDLPQEPISLHDFQTRFPHLATGPGSPVFTTADLPPPVRLWLRSGGWIRRALAFLLDLAPLLLLLLIGLRGGAELSYRYPAPFQGANGPTLIRLGLWGGFLFLYLGYFTVWESLMGWTPGKLVMGIRVVDSYGLRPRFRVGILRSLLRILDLPLLASLILAPLTLSDGNRRRRGDRVAKTWVVQA